MITFFKGIAKRAYNAVLNYFWPTRDPLLEIEKSTKGLKDSLKPTWAETAADVVSGVVTSSTGAAIGGAIATACAAPVAITVSAVVIVGAMAGYAGKKIRDSEKRQFRQSTIDKIADQRNNYFTTKLNQIESSRSSNTLDLVLNTPIFDVLGLELIDMSNIIKEMLAVLNDRKNQNNKPILTSIDFSNTKLNDSQLKDLLAAGLGQFGTKTLNLANNDLTFEGIRALESAVVRKKTAFQNLKVMNLQGNKLMGDCLQSIANIVEYLEIEELNISSNSFEKGNAILGANSRYSSNLEKFILEAHTKMPSLKRLHMRECGFRLEAGDAARTGGGQVKAITEYLTKISLLQYFDLSNNSGIKFKHLENTILSKGLSVNHSVKEIVVDHSEQLYISQKVDAKSKALSAIHCIGEKSDSRAILLLNYRMNNAFPKNLLEHMPNKTDEHFVTIIEAIEEARENVLGVDSKLKIRISEKEFIKHMKQELDQFYQGILNNESRDQVAPELIANITKKPQEKNSCAKSTRAKTVPVQSAALPANNTQNIPDPVLPKFQSLRQMRNIQSGNNQPTLYPRTALKT